MAQYVDYGHKAFPANAAISQYLRVKLVSLNGAPAVDVAGLADREAGVATRPAFAQGDPVDVRLTSASGTCPMVASGAITLLAEVYSDAGGKVSATQGSNAVLIGTALTAASGDGAVIEVLRAAAAA